MKWNIGTRIASGYALGLAILVVIGAVAYKTNMTSIETQDWVSHTYKVLGTVGEIVSLTKDYSFGRRGYVITGDEKFLEGYLQTDKIIDGRISELQKLTADNPRQQPRITALIQFIAQERKFSIEAIDLRKSKGFEAARDLVLTGKGAEIRDEMQKLSQEMVDDENALLSQRLEAAKNAARRAQGTIVFGTLLAFALLGFAGFWITRGIVRELREGVNVLASSSSEIMATTKQVSTGATDTATAVSETTTTVEQVKQTVQMANQKAKEVSENSQKMAQVSQGGKKSVEELIGGMRRVQEQMESIADRAVKLSEQIKMIGEIAASVNDLAEQSNLLAVNAAIEAAKAGEQGRGFAVVAQEVRSLAEQSKQATAQVHNILKEIEKATSAVVLVTEQGSKVVQAGVLQSNAAGDSIGILSESIEKAAQAATQIAVSSQQQLIGMDQIVIAMQRIKEASSQNVATAKQAEGISHNLHDLGARLKQMAS